MPHVEQELLTLPDQSVLSEVRVVRSFVFYVMFVDRCLSRLLFRRPMANMIFVHIGVFINKDLRHNFQTLK